MYCTTTAFKLTSPVGVADNLRVIRRLFHGRSGRERGRLSVDLTSFG